MANIGPLFTECEIEIPAQMCVDLNAKMTAEFFERGGIKPTNIIRCGQASGVRVKFDFTAAGTLKRLLCGKVCIKVAYESCGRGPESQVVRWINFNLCEQDVYQVEIELPENFFCPAPMPADDCGTVFCLCISAVVFDNCKTPQPVGIGAFCKGPCILVMP
ncbi:MAG: hypothetical protein SF339_08420 [Blastocatellia bacterium]|nr:hypothetical protein [Blastocatellia bacterium]